ncbi:histidine kinase, dimerization and phosphoacceptor region [Streptomyces zinciresistens K42]|uniref:histidine kinase n=1 Tax=Streptomyces zinciresistens K42 TaxID=700597 RepID=G2GLV1_9ACTN|nr:histidine kinase, dimerization and phosphoacceptor region [Streptomyces zinciresistens K42]
MASWVSSRREYSARWDRLDAVKRDALGVVLLAPVAFLPVTAPVGAQFGDLPQRPYDIAGVLLTASLWLPLVVRRRWPAACLTLVAAAFAARELAGYPPTFASVGLYAALAGAGAHGGRTAGKAVPWAGSALFALFALALHERGSPQNAAAFVLIYLVLAAFWGAGVLLRGRRAASAERRLLAAEAAVARERALIARELHDVVTHHVTAMVVQADAARFVLADAPDRVATGLEAIGDSGRRALSDLQDLLGLLKTSPAREQEPVPASLEELVLRTRAAGQPVELTEDGERRPAGAAVELAAYRVVQEALTNALKHAPGHPTRVAVRHRATEMEVEVTTGARPLAAPRGAAEPERPAEPVRGGGHGLTGLRERVALCGGELRAGALPDGGFGVRARMPVAAGGEA